MYGVGDNADSLLLCFFHPPYTYCTPGISPSRVTYEYSPHSLLFIMGKDKVRVSTALKAQAP